MNVSHPSTHYFLRMFTSYIRPSSQVSCLSEFLCYLSILEGETYLKFSPSEIAISSLILSSHTYSEEETLLVGDFLSQTLSVMASSTSQETDLKKTVINECITSLSNSYSLSRKHPQQAIYSRYSSSKFFSVASIGLIESRDDLPHLLK